MTTPPAQTSTQGIAIVGMAGRFPGARDVEAFWKNLRNGVESISFFSDDELVAAGVDPAHLKDPNYVKARPVMDDAEFFDASFFGFTPADAANMDPQQRVFLECAWEALENAGCDPERFDGAIGLYAGLNRNTYLLANLCTNPEFIENLLDAKKAGFFQAMLGNEKDFIATRAAFKLNLRGPAITIQTACSTSLVAVNMACQSLLTFQSDAALAGGISITFPQTKGYVYQEGGIESSDGHCRVFDATAQGTVFGSGVGLVVLKRLDDALASGDQIYAVIKGSAINNDGATKVSYTAPSVEGQVEVVQLAQALAGIPPETISYVEAHGTGTALGDPVEVSALSEAFRVSTDRKQFCAIGSVKTNVGHLDVAAGVTGLIKTALSLHHREIPPSLHFDTPNPKLELENSPFFVNTRLMPWERRGTPLRAAVSSFGVGGTNAHAVLEEAPARLPSGPSRPWQLLPLSARNEAALERASVRLRDHLKNTHGLNIADAAFTLQTGRREFSHRRVVLCRDTAEAVAVLEKPDARHVFDGIQTGSEAPVVFMFPGQGSQYVGMGAELYETEPVFRAELDRCVEILRPLLGLDLRTLIHPSAADAADAEVKLKQTRYTQPALFAFEYSLARLWMSWGVQPSAMIGHSVGEYVAACISGVFSLEDALKLIARRGELVQSCDEGSMLAVRLPEKEVLPYLDENLCIAAVNAPNLCVAAGPHADIDALEQRLRDEGHSSIRLRTSHAFHSRMMDPILEAFTETLRSVPMQAPQIPYVSNVTARWIGDADAVNPEFWAGHVRQPVRFADGLAEILNDPQRVLLEIGPGQTLANLARQHPARQSSQVVLASLGGAKESESAAILGTLGKLWLADVDIDWTGFYAAEERRRIPLPTYPFEKQRHFIDAPRVSGWVRDGSVAPAKTAPAALASASADSVATVAATASASSEAAAEPSSRRERIAAGIHKMLFDLSDMQLTPADRSRPWIELGFDSLFLTLARQEVQTVFGVRVTFRQLLDDVTTIDALTDFLDKALPPDGVESETETPAPEAAPVSAAPAKAFPLTDQQREIWLACQLAPETSCAYNDASALTLRGALDIDALRTAIQAVYVRHEALRLTFASDGSGQKESLPVTLDIPLIDFSSQSETARRDQLADTLSAEMSEAFDLVNGPLFRAKVLRLAPEEHVLIVAAHHLVCDGWSWNILLDDLGQLYSARIRSRACELPTPTPFSEFARMQEQLHAGANYAATEAYWLQRFANLPPPLSLPTDFPRSADTKNQGACEELRIDRELLQALRKTGARHGATFFVVVLSALHVLLQRLSGQKNSVIAICSAGQTMAGAERVVGHCVNLLPIYNPNEDDLPFTRFTTQIKDLMQAANEHENYTYGKLVEKLALPREPGRPPLINAMFTLSPEGDIPFEGLQVSEEICAKSVVNFDLLFGARETEDGFIVDVNYNRDLFRAETIQRWMGHLHAMLRGIAAAPETPLSALPMLAEADRHQLLVDWNDTAMAYPDVCVHQLFEARVAEKPDAIALIVDDERVTYAELNSRANRIARRLRALGVGPESLVGIFMERSADMVCAMMGVFKSGGAYVPMDPAYPADRIAYMLRDSRAHTVLTEDKLIGKLRDFTTSLTHMPHMVCVDTDEKIAACEDTNPRIVTRPEHLCYVFYTSGSTGRPKGVAVEHRNSVAFIQWAGVVFDAQQLDGVLASTSICFDLSVFELWVTLGHGGKIILADHALLLPALSAANEVRLIVTVPSIMRELLRMKALPESLKTVTSGGEYLPVDIVQQLHTLPHIDKVWDLYGPTETTTYSMFALRRPDEPATIGRPIANTSLYILDEHLQPVPVGTLGELFIGGAGVTRGYLNQPELTAKKFIPNPFAAKADERIYRTGDLCRYRPDGNVEYAGRIDHQVKIRGLRIELGEIEAAVRAHPLVAEAVVIAHEDSPGKQRLVAYLSRHPGAPAGPEAEIAFRTDLRRHLETRLPQGMIPETLVLLPRLPLTPNGKIDRKALPAPVEEDAASAAPEIVAPRTLTEETLAAIWSELLEHADFGVNDDFFRLGGHSLLALRMIARVRESLQIDLPIKTVFQSPTIAGLALFVDQALIEEIGSLSDEQAETATNEMQPLGKPGDARTAS